MKTLLKRQWRRCSNRKNTLNIKKTSQIKIEIFIFNCPFNKSKSLFITSIFISCKETYSVTLSLDSGIWHKIWRYYIFCYLTGTEDWRNNINVCNNNNNNGNDYGEKIENCKENIYYICLCYIWSEECIGKWNWSSSCSVESYVRILSVSLCLSLSRCLFLCLSLSLSIHIYVDFKLSYIPWRLHR